MHPFRPARKRTVSLPKIVDLTMPKRKTASKKGRKRKLARDDKQEADVSPPKKKQKTKKQTGNTQKAKRDDWIPPMTRDVTNGREGTPHIENPTIIRGKWIYNGCDTVDTMIEALKRQIGYLEGLRDHGWDEIEQNHGDDYVFILNKDRPRYPQYDDEEWF